MLILGLGYITVKSDKLEDWTEFSRDYLGMQLVDKTKSTAVLRMDERKQRFVVTNETNSSNIFGWEVADKKDLALLASRLEKAEIVVTKEPKFIKIFPSPSKTKIRFLGFFNATPNPIDDAKPIEPIM